MKKKTFKKHKHIISHSFPAKRILLLLHVFFFISFFPPFYSTNLEVLKGSRQNGEHVFPGASHSAPVPENQSPWVLRRNYLPAERHKIAFLQVFFYQLKRQLKMPTPWSTSDTVTLKSSAGCFDLGNSPWTSSNLHWRDP